MGNWYNSEMKKSIGGMILGIIAGVIVWHLMFNKQQMSFLNPGGKKETIDQRTEMRVVGFLPPWNINKTKINTEVLDELVFLGIESDEDGLLVWDSQARKINNEIYLAMKAEMREMGKKNIVGIKLFEDNKLNKLLASQDNINRLVREIEGVVVAGGFDGVNIDFEYQGNPVAILNESFFDFLQKLKQAEVGEIGVDVFCNTINKGEVEKLGKLWQVADYVLVMAYDFTRPGVDYTGPVAPIKSLPGKRNIWETITRVTDLGLDTKKLVAAYPLYGYEWKTETNEFGSKIKRGWYQTASLGRIKELIKENKEIVRNWDELSLTPWLVWREGGEWRQIYYDDEVSLKEKIKLAVEMNLEGVGFWALGYEGNGEVWEMVAEEVK